MSRYDWMEDARCAQIDPDLWHAEGSGHGYTEAEQICARCPVLQQCADHTARLEGNASKRERHGLWAGQSPRDRLARSGHVTRESKHDVILRLTARGGMDAYEIAKVAEVDVRTVWRVLRNHRDQMRKAA
ncbi:WhiB family transcriptional regulator [Streptomyces sp. MN13]